MVLNTFLNTIKNAKKPYNTYFFGVFSLEMVLYLKFWLLKVILKEPKWY